MADWFCLDCRVVMKWKDKAFWKCPVCGTEVWPPDPDEIESQKKQINEIAGMVSRSWVPGTEAKGGGGASGRKHKKPEKHTSFDSRYRSD